MLAEGECSSEICFFCVCMMLWMRVLSTHFRFVSMFFFRFSSLGRLIPDDYVSLVALIPVQFTIMFQIGHLQALREGSLE